MAAAAARSVLECSSPLPLSKPGAPYVAARTGQSARGLAQSKTWRLTGARNLFRFNTRVRQAFERAPSLKHFEARSGLKSALLTAVAALFLCSASAHAHPFTIDWFTSSGSTSTGGVYSVSGTIGQPDAGKMSGGNFSIDDGFWGIIAAVPTPGSPLLTISLNSQLSTVTISWPLPATGFVLDQSLTVTGTWSQVSFPYATNATHISVTVSPPVGNKFYRLRKP